MPLLAIHNTSMKPAELLVVGVMLTISSALSFAPRLRKPEFARENPRWLALLALPIGVETGFSSAGAGALGTILRSEERRVGKGCRSERGRQPEVKKEGGGAECDA